GSVHLSPSGTSRRRGAGIVDIARGHPAAAIRGCDAMGSAPLRTHLHPPHPRRNAMVRPVVAPPGSSNPLRRAVPHMGDSAASCLALRNGGLAPELPGQDAASTT